MMNKLIIAAVGLLICVYASFAGAYTTVPDTGLLSGDWSVKETAKLNAEPKDAVWKFINDQSGNSDLSPANGKLCYFKFVDLRHSGELSLVVADDNGGTAECNDVEILDKTRAGIEDYDFNQAGMSSYESIEEINGDGNHELVVNRIFDSGGIDHCTATWPVIYAWTGNNYSDVSRDYKGYYKQQLASLQKQIAAAEAQKELAEEGSSAENAGLTASADSEVAVGQQSGDESPPSAPPPTGEHGPSASFSAVKQSPPMPPSQPLALPQPDQGELDCTKAEAAKIERFIGISRDAGMSDAVKWTESNDPITRRFGTSILSDIGTQEAIEDLQTLSNDLDRNVAMSAKASLASVKTPTVNSTIQGELLTKDSNESSAK
jgi:hypothetical protein